MDRAFIEKHLVSRKSLILDNYKRVGLTDVEAMVVLQIIRFGEANTRFVTEEILAKVMHANKKEINSALSKMTELGFIRIVDKDHSIELCINNLLDKIIKLYTPRHENTYIEEIEKIINRKVTDKEEKTISEYLPLVGSTQALINTIREANAQNKNLDLTKLEKIIEEFKERNIHLKRNLDTLEFSSVDFNWLED